MNGVAFLTYPSLNLHSPPLFSESIVSFKIPCAHVTRNLDHGFVYGWNQTASDCPHDDVRVHPDAFTSRGWGVLYSGGVLNYAHHSAGGLSTALVMKSGMLLVTLYFLRAGMSNRDKFSTMFYDLCDIEYDRSSLSEGLEAETVALYPGDAVYVSIAFPRPPPTTLP